MKLRNVLATAAASVASAALPGCSHSIRFDNRDLPKCDDVEAESGQEERERLEKSDQCRQNPKWIISLF